MTLQWTAPEQTDSLEAALDWSTLIDDRRRSGVLVPSVGYSENTGADVSVPYYFNLAENNNIIYPDRALTETTEEVSA